LAKEEINAFLGVGTAYRGRLDFTGAVRIDGTFEGEVESEGTLVVGREAVITGQVRVGQLVLGGKLDGEVSARQRVVLHKTAKFTGNMSTPALSVEEGATLEGTVRMGNGAEVSQEEPDRP
jgi:cytoskeletal protein CcmA (bactofilin family)